VKTLIYSSHDFEKSYLQRAAKGKQELIFTNQSLDPQSASDAKEFSAISLFTSDNALADVLDILNVIGIRYITLRSVGHDHVDLHMAKKLGIKVSNVPAYSPYSIAEHAVTLLLAINRKLVQGQKLIEHQNFCLDSLIGFDLHSKTIGIVGTGKIGAAYARIMNGFGCKLLGHDIVHDRELIAQTGIMYTTLEDLCKNSDVVSLHCPLTSDTNQLFNRDVFSKMKKGIILVNTARGGIVNTIDLIEAIENGTIAAAGLDVYENEKSLFFINHFDKPIQDSIFEKLRSFPNVLITGHQAFLTKEAITCIAETTIDNLMEYKDKGVSKNDLV
jgi:D-lactate dehydrogenase